MFYSSSFLHTHISTQMGPSELTRFCHHVYRRDCIRIQDADNATLHWDWNPVRRPKAVTGHGSAGRRPSLGLHWARECRPKAVTGLHWARECRPKAVTGHGSAGRRPSLACTGHGSARPKANTPVPVRHCLHPGIPCIHENRFRPVPHTINVTPDRPRDVFGVVNSHRKAVRR